MAETRTQLTPEEGCNNDKHTVACVIKAFFKNSQAWFYAEHMQTLAKQQLKNKNI